LTERVCPLVVKLFSPSFKYRHSSPPPISLSPTSSALLSLDKPTFGLSVRLLRILNVLIREFYFSLVGGAMVGMVSIVTTCMYMYLMQLMCAYNNVYLWHIYQEEMYFLSW